MDDSLVTFWSALEGAETGFALLGFGGLTIAGSGAVAYGFFKWFGAKWIDHKFESQMEAYKTEQSRELEKLRHKINGIFDRTIRLHTKEFEVLPDLWGKLIEADEWARKFLSPMQFIPNVAQMKIEELKEYLNGTYLAETQKREILDETSRQTKQKIFNEFWFRDKCNEAQEKFNEFAISLKKDGIFVKPEIKTDLDAMLTLLRAAIIEEKMNIEDDTHPRNRKAQEEFWAERNLLLERIEKAIADRLWDSTTTEV